MRRTTIRGFFLQVIWMFFALLAPELLLCFAWSERLAARILLNQALRFHPRLKRPGKRTRMYNWIRRRRNVSA
jgi:hypothetical protein